LIICTESCVPSFETIVSYSALAAIANIYFDKKADVRAEFVSRARFGFPTGSTPRIKRRASA